MSVRDEVFAPAVPRVASAQGDSMRGVRILGALRGPELFGHERGNIEAFKALRAAGADVRVAVPTKDNGGAVRRELERLGFTVYPMTFGAQWSKSFIINDPLHLPGNILAWVRCQFAFDRAIRDFRPTHVQLGNALAFNFVELAIRRHRLPLVLRLGDAPPVGSAVQMALWRRYIRRSHRVMAISQYIWDVSAAQAPELRRLTPCVIYNLAPTPTESARPADFDRNRRHVVYVGQIIPEKGVFHLLEAAVLLGPQFGDVVFHFVGSSIHTTDTEAELRRRAEQLGLRDQVVFHGWVGNVSEMVAGADVHVAPSICQEALGNVVLEAKREGTPSVVYPSGGLPEMIRSGVDGMVCSRPNIGDLAEGIAWALTSMRTRPGLRAAIQADFHTRFGPDRFGPAWQELYQRKAT